MSARVYFMKRVNGCKDESIMSPQDEQCSRTSFLHWYFALLLLLSTTVCSQNINKQNVNIADETLTDYSFLSRYHNTKSKTESKSSLNSHVYWGTLYHFSGYTKPDNPRRITRNIIGIISD